MTKEEKKDEMKNRISMALQDPMLQQGFEIICKNLTDLEKENKRVKQGCHKWFMRWREVKREELEQIADIKANCDLAIEGRDIKIKELELELTVEKDQHQEETNLHLHAEDYIKSLEQKLEQTEKDLADYQFNYPTIKELSKENAELKELLNCNNCSELSEEECEVCAEYSHFKCKRKDLLTKAKDHIKQNKE